MLPPFAFSSLDARAQQQVQQTQKQQSVAKVTAAASPEIESLSRERHRPPWEGTRDSSTIPFVISASGGISLGSYQAGVTWALGRLTRLVADSQLIRDSLGLGRPVLWATTGASAGNINAVLSALEWCAQQPVPPEKSLFWRVWINVGWPELFPDENLLQNTQDFGIFDRSYFKNVLFKDIEHRMDTTAVNKSCGGFPMGVTATRVDPSFFQVTNRLNAQTQRFAATFQLDTGVRGKKLVFRQADSTLRDRGMGEMLALAVGKSNVLGGDTLFSLIEASSSFPVAFSPRRLAYYPADSLAKNGFCPDTIGVCKPPHRAYFTDGGVFDNNPLQLAFDIYERRADKLVIASPVDGRTIASVPTVPPRALYVGTDDYRGPLDSLRAREIDRGPVGGVDAIGRLIMGAIPAARQYEMQTLARSIADDQRVPRNYIRVTTRYFPVFGEHLGAFGAFLGRPFREWDFYAGLYDGIVFAARDVICTPRTGFDTTKHGGTERCAKDFARTLIDSQIVDLGPIARYILDDMWAIEFRDATPRPPIAFRPPNVSATDARRLRALRSLTRVQMQQLDRRTSRAPARKCKKPDWADTFLCGNDLDLVLASIKRDTVAWASYRAWSQAPPCTDTTATLENPCLADRTFVALIDNPPASMKERAGQIMHRMWEVEHAFELLREKTKRDARPADVDTFPVPVYAPAHDGLVEFAEMMFRSTDWPARRGIDLDPSSIPPHAHGPLKFFSSLVPYQASLGLRIGGFDVGWQPSYHLSDTWMIQAPFSVSSFHQLYEIPDTTRSTFLRGGLGLAKKGSGFTFNSYGLAVRPTLVAMKFRPGLKSFHAAWPHQPLKMISYEASTVALAGKVRLSVYRVGNGLVNLGGESRRWGWTIGMTDLPGIVYWLKR